MKLRVKRGRAMSNKIKIEYEKEFVNYLYINRDKYLNMRILDFEVRFKVCMKSIDMLGEDEEYYYIIEVKREAISEDDYNNLEYIIRNNRYDKPFKGLLIGTKSNKRIERMCKESGNIDFKIISDVVYKKNAKKLEEFKLNRDLGRIPYCDLCRNLFNITNGMNMYSCNKKATEIDVIYKYKLERELYLHITKENIMLFNFKKHKTIKERWIEESTRGIMPYLVDEFLFVQKYSYLIEWMKCEYFNKDSISKEYKAIHDVLKPLQNYLSLNDIKFNGKNKLLITGTQFLGIRIIKTEPYERYIIFPELYMYIVENNMDKIKNIKDTFNYNTVNLIQCCYVFIGKKLYKPDIRVEFNNEYISIILELKFNNGEIIKRHYEVTDENGHMNRIGFKNEFYLVSNIYFILDFNKYVINMSNKMKCKIDEFYFDSYTTSLYNHLIKREKYVYLRKMIESQGEDAERIYEEVMNEEFDVVKSIKWKQKIAKRE